MPKRKPKDKDRSPDLPHNWIERHIERLEALCYYDPLPLTKWEYQRSRLVAPARYETVDDIPKTIQLGDTWGGADITARFRRRLVVPASHASADAYLDIDLDGGETQLSINGRLWQGLDHFRSLVPLAELAVAGEELLLEMEAFTINYPYDRRRNDERDLHEFRRADLVLRDAVIDDCRHDLLAVFDAYLHFWSSDEDLEIEAMLRTHLEDACRLLGPGFASRESAREAAAAASELLAERVFASGLYRPGGRINLHAHSHLDLVYLWPIKETFRKNGRTTSNALSLLREFPDYSFSQSQPFLYEKLKEHYPALFEEVKSEIAAGRWEAVGATYVEPDANLVGAESWVRQILFGKRTLKELFGVDSRVCWLPDVFGAMHTLPQILKKSGVDYFLTAKLNIWNDTNVFPWDSFRWRGPDGSEVITHFPPTHFAQDLTYGNLRRQWRDYREKTIADENLFIFGWGDGGGGPTREMVERTRRLKRFPGLPDVSPSTAGAFFERLEKHSDELPVWDDELYMEGHRGTYTSKGELKRNNADAEALYREVETLSSIAAAFGGPSVQARLNEGWKLLLLNQFHDTLPGSHVPDAMPDIRSEYSDVFSLGRSIRDELSDFISSRIAGTPELVVFNTMNERFGLVAFDYSGEHASIELAGGERTPLQVDEGRGYFRAALPSTGWLTASPVAEQTAAATTTATRDGDTIETPFYRMTLDTGGRIGALYDKSNDREVLAGPGNELQVFEDDPGKKFGAWDIAYHVEEYRYPVEQAAAWEMAANGPLFARFVARFAVLESTIEQEMILYADDPRIDFRTRVDWRDPKKLLKVAFPLTIRSRTASYGQPFGHIERATHRNTGWEQAKFEVTAHRWADLSEGDYGVALLNDCKYGYDARENVLRLSLLRSPVFPTPDSDLGEHEFSYALLPHGGGWREAGVDRAAYAFGSPPLVVERAANQGTAGEELPLSFSLVAVSGRSAIIEVVKQSEDGTGLVVRLFDSHGTHAAVNIDFGTAIENLEETDLLEAEGIAIDSGERVRLRFSPYEIKTLKLQLVRP